MTIDDFIEIDRLMNVVSIDNYMRKAIDMILVFDLKTFFKNANDSRRSRGNQYKYCKIIYYGNHDFYARITSEVQKLILDLVSLPCEFYFRSLQTPLTVKTPIYEELESKQSILFGLVEKILHFTIT